MPKNWKTYRLGDIIDYQKGYAFKSKWYQNFGKLIVRISDTTSDSIDISTCYRIAKEHAESLIQYELLENDIIIASVGSWPPNYNSVVGKVVKVPKAAEESLLNQNAVRLRTKDKNNFNQKFIYDAMKTSSFLNYIVNRAQGSASQASIKLTDIFGFEVQIPPLPEQTQIANILSVIDDKIENNLAINKTLEDMAMSLYKHWFVDFGPFQEGEFVDSELGLIPKGWEVKRLEDLFAIKPINGLYKKKEFQGFGSRWLKMKSVYGIDIITNECMELIDVSEKEIEKYGCLKNDIVFGRTSLVLEGIGTCAIIKSNINISVFESNLFRYRFDENLVSPDLMFFYFKSPLGRHEVKKLARQTAAVSITSSDVSKIKVALPSKKKQMELSVQLERLLEKIVFNKEENQTLTKLRDTLLPKLISGEVRLKEFREEIDAEMNSA
jgi:type I restriction enzyme S subunit